MTLILLVTVCVRQCVSVLTLRDKPYHVLWTVEHKLNYFKGALCIHLSS